MFWALPLLTTTGMIKSSHHHQYLGHTQHCRAGPCNSRLVLVSTVHTKYIYDELAHTLVRRRGKIYISIYIEQQKDPFINNKV